MARVVIECDRCDQKLSVPKKNGQVECPKCTNLITLRFQPKVVSTPSWFNKKLGFLLMFIAVIIWNNVMVLRTRIVDAADLFEGLAQLFCFAGILVVAFADFVRHRGRLTGDQAYPVASESETSTNGTSGSFDAYIAPEFGTKFYLSIAVPLLMIPVSFIVPSALDWCRHPAFRECNEVDEGAYIFMLFLPFATALAIMTMGVREKGLPESEVLAGAKISGVLTFAFFAMMSFLIMTIHP